jgi:hypothetical protein
VCGAGRLAGVTRENEKIEREYTQTATQSSKMKSRKEIERRRDSRIQGVDGRCTDEECRMWSLKVQEGIR